ncbi:DUF2239 family protein [uncultured Paraglaciecola sp.]
MRTVLVNTPAANTYSGRHSQPKLGVKAKEVTLLPCHWE